MYSDDENYSTSISEFCSQKEKTSQEYQKENARLRKAYTRMMEMNNQLSDNLTLANDSLKQKDE